MKPENFRHLLAVLSKNKVSVDDQNIWIQVCTKLDDEGAMNVIKALENATPKEVKFLTGNIKDKLKAMSGGDPSLEEKIVTDEEKFLAITK